MLSPEQAQARCQALVERARAAGADVADALFSASSSQSVQVRLGALEDVERSESEHASLRVFVGRGTASIGSSDLSDAALGELAERAVAMARAAPEDKFAGLAPDEMLLRGAPPQLDLVDPQEYAPAELRARAEAAEDAARAVAGVTNSEGGSASLGASVVALATSAGFAGGYATTSHSLSASVVAGEGAGMQRDYAWRVAHHASDLPSAAEIGQLAGTRAVARLDPQPMTSGPRPVVFSPRVGGSLVGHLLGAISGAAIARKASFLLGREGQQIFAPGIVIRDDPHRRRGVRSRPFDGEGLPTAARALVEDGRITGWLMDSAAARQLGLAPTGHATRGHGGAPGVSAGNVTIEPGACGVAELIGDIADGVYVTELIGQGVNGVTGDYSRGASGLRIVNGQFAGPVAGITIAGNLLAMFAQLSAADDLETYRGIDVPTLRVDGMTVAGE
ncbi:MAG: metallopeptidase TldD-related protein [Novosphingobium sp.]|nr:metallopeptidase TldD-related protein [Novosphingobium sp.]